MPADDEWHALNSSWVAAARYVNNRLHVRFRNGFIATYTVDRSYFEELLNALSPGRYVRQNLYETPYGFG